MGYLFFILAMGPMCATHVYCPHPYYDGICHAHPRTFAALTCPANQLGTPNEHRQ